jgi:hypothetical protein
LVIDGELVCWVDVERHKSDIKDTLIGRMSSQLGVRPRQFRQMIECSLSKADFLELKGIAVDSPSDSPREVSRGSQSALPPAPPQLYQ